MVLCISFSHFHSVRWSIFSMELSELIPHIEALVFASDKPLTGAEITELVNAAFGFMEDKVTEEQITTALEGIAEKYDSEFYPFTVKQSGGGWQFLTKKEYHKTVAQLNGEKFLKRLSAAALETLSIIAYKQPVTKGEIESIRGVSADYAIQKLLEKELIIITGRNELAPGHPLVYATSKSFMDYFGLNNATELPKIKEVLSENIIAPTLINHTEGAEESMLAVADDGELIDRTGGVAEEAKLFINEATTDRLAEDNGAAQPENENGANADKNLEADSNDLPEEKAGDSTADSLE